MSQSQSQIHTFDSLEPEQYTELDLSDENESEHPSDIECDIDEMNDHENQEDDDANQQFSVSSDEEKEDDNDSSRYNGNIPLYEKSAFSIKEFDVSFILLCNKIKLDKKNRSLLLNYLKLFLPLGNKIPLTYSTLLKRNNVKKPISTEVCSKCYREYTEPKCPSCNSMSLVQITKFDLKKELISVVNNNWNAILSYESKCLPPNLF